MQSTNKTGFPSDQLYFIADIGANHDGDINRAFRLIELAKEAGANAAKFQNFKAAKIVSDEGFKNMKGNASHQSDWNESVFQTYSEASIEDEWSWRLKEKCDEVGIDYFTSPYDFESVDHANKYADIFKIGSGDITWPEIIHHIATKAKPVIIATGASAMTDVFRAVSILESYDVPLCLMQCNTNYVAGNDKLAFTNLNVLRTYERAFPNLLLGLSDHSFGHATVCGAIALGARIIEKHFTDDNGRIGPDHKFAMNPTSWKTMVAIGLEVLSALGDGVKRVEPNEVDSRVVQQRAIYPVTKIPEGQVITRDKLAVLRPCPEQCIRPYDISLVLGKPAPKDLQAQKPLEYEDFLNTSTRNT